jgi:hypothetical protein
MENLEGAANKYFGYRELFQDIARMQPQNFQLGKPRF